jgi:flavin-dependent dehydrogenase
MRPQPALDVLIFGDGPAGLACGLAGLAAGLKVALLSPASPRPCLPVGEHLPPKARTSLHRLGVTLPANSLRACASIAAWWGSDQARFTDYLFSPFGSGLNVLRPAFECALQRTFADRGGHLPGPARPAAIRRQGGRFAVEFEGAPDLEARWLIDATGRASALARRLGAKPIAYDRLIGLVADLRAPAGAPAGLVVEANAQGWCYAVTLGGGGTRVVALTDADLMPRAGRRADLWRHLVGAGSVLRHLADAAPPRVEVVSARTQRLGRAGGEGWLAVGDAAMAFDPLASDGIAKALDDGIEAVAALAGGPDALRRREARLAERFDRYCQEHGVCYGLERRWPDRAFWRRRHAGAVASQPIVLDPEILLQRATTRGGDDACRPLETEICFPLTDPEPVLRIATRPLPAHVLVRHTRPIAALGALTDRDRIRLVQTLLSIGALRIVQQDTVV